MTLQKTKKKVGLALGGGGAKGLAHIGVIKELERMGIEISFITGTSMGALVGAWYAATKDIKTLENLFLGVKKDNIFPIGRLIRRHDGNIFKDPIVPDFYESHLDGITFDECKIPFKAVATDVKDGSQVILSEGKIMDAVRASTALPIMFNPVEIGGRILMDGGFVNPVPADIAKEMGADIVIAVDVSSKWIDLSEMRFDVLHVSSLVVAAMSVVEFQVAKKVLHSSADVVLNPPVLSYSWLAFNNAKELIEYGQREAYAHRGEISKCTGHALTKKSPFEAFMDFILYSD
ncbi:MAG: patatin-like phospholipase family protein [Candidatus Paceibacterota bacterium]|jgi:NTE family protein